MLCHWVARIPFRAHLRRTNEALLYNEQTKAHTQEQIYMTAEYFIVVHKFLLNT